MEEQRLDSLAKTVSETEQPLDAVKILNEIEPCERENVLRKAVDLKNEKTNGNPFYILSVEQSETVRKDSLSLLYSGVFSTIKVPLLEIEVPRDCR